MPAPTVPTETVRHELPFPSQVDHIVLSGSAKTVTKPTGVSWLWIATSATCYFRTGGTAVSPSGDVVDGTGSFPINAGNGLLLNVKTVATFSIIGTANVGLAWYRDREGGIL